MGTYCSIGEAKISLSSDGSNYTIRADVESEERNSNITGYTFEYSISDGSHYPIADGQWVQYNTSKSAPSSTSFTIPSSDLIDKYIIIRVGNTFVQDTTPPTTVMIYEQSAPIYGKPSAPIVEAVKRTDSNIVMINPSTISSSIISKGLKVYRLYDSEEPVLLYEFYEEDGGGYNQLYRSYEDKNPPAATSLKPIYYEAKLVSKTDFSNEKENLSEFGISNGITASRAPYAPSVTVGNNATVIVGKTENIEVTWQFNTFDGSMQSKAEVHLYSLLGNNKEEIFSKELGTEAYCNIDISDMTIPTSGSLMVEVVTWGIDQEDSAASAPGVVYINVSTPNVIAIDKDYFEQTGNIRVSRGGYWGANPYGIATISSIDTSEPIASISSYDSADTYQLFETDDKTKSIMAEGGEYDINVTFIDTSNTAISASDLVTSEYSGKPTKYAPKITNIEKLDGYGIRIFLDLRSEGDGGATVDPKIFVRYFSIYCSNGVEVKPIVVRKDILDLYPEGTSLSTVWNKTVYDYVGNVYTALYQAEVAFDVPTPDLDDKLEFFAYSHNGYITRSPESNHYVDEIPSGGSIVLNHGALLSQVDILRKNASYSSSNERAQAKFNVVGKEHPLIFFGDSMGKDVTISASISYPDETTRWEYILQNTNIAFVRAPGGFSHLCSIDSSSINKPQGIGSATISINMTVIDDE